MLFIAKRRHLHPFTLPSQTLPSYYVLTEKASCLPADTSKAPSHVSELAYSHVR